MINELLESPWKLFYTCVTPLSGLFVAWEFHSTMCFKHVFQAGEQLAVTWGSNRLNGAWLMIYHLNLPVRSNRVWVTLVQALSWCKRIPFVSLPLRLFSIAQLNLVHGICGWISKVVAYKPQKSNLRSKFTLGENLDLPPLLSSSNPRLSVA